MVGNAVLILILGMGGVFLFLFVLVLIMTIIARCLPPNERELNPAKSKQHAAKSVTAGDEELIAVLQAAVHAYENDPQLHQA